MKPLTKLSRIAKKLGVAESTVRAWIKDGLYPNPDVRAPTNGEGPGMALWYLETTEAWYAEYEYGLDQGLDKKTAARAATKRAGIISAAIKTEVRAERERFSRRRERYLRDETDAIPGAIVAT